MLAVNALHFASVSLILTVTAVSPVVVAAPPSSTERPIERGPSDAKAVAFGCNVVWGTEYVRPLEEIFLRHRAHATFFLGGKWAESEPALARELARAGMELGNHGYAHRHVSALDELENRREIQLAHEAIWKASGVHPTLYAPAYGEVSSAVLRAARLEGYRTVLWTIDTVDWRPSHSKAVITQRVLSRLAPGAIILIHPTDRTVAALPGLLDALGSQGYRVVSVSDLLAGRLLKPSANAKVRKRRAATVAA